MVKACISMVGCGGITGFKILKVNLKIISLFALHLIHPSPTMETHGEVCPLLKYQVTTKITANLFSANRKWIPAVEVLSAVKDGHLTIENLLLVSFHHCLDNFSTQNNATLHFWSSQAHLEQAAQMFLKHHAALDNSAKLIVLQPPPSPQTDKHLCYDRCLEVRGEIMRTVLCCVVYWSCAQS